MARQRLIVFIVVSLLSVATTAGWTRLHGQEGKGAMPVVGCPWRTMSGDVLLARRIGALEVADRSLAGDVLALLWRRSIPISFLEGDKDSLVTLHLSDPTVREVLDAIIAQAREYAYSVVRGHLVLYTRRSAYKLPLRGFVLSAMPRLQAVDAMVDELRKRYPAFAKLESPIMSGTTASYFLYDDLVTVTGADSVLDGLAQLLGERPGATLSIVLTRWTGRAPQPGERFFNLRAVEQLKSIEVMPVIASMHVGEQVQLKVTATGVDGAREDLTVAACGTSYQVIDPKVVSVDSNGLLRALSPGDAEVVVQSEMQLASLSFKVAASGGKVK